MINNRNKSEHTYSPLIQILVIIIYFYANQFELNPISIYIQSDCVPLDLIQIHACTTHSVWTAAIHSFLLLNNLSYVSPLRIVSIFSSHFVASSAPFSRSQRFSQTWLISRFIYKKRIILIISCASALACLQQQQKTTIGPWQKVEGYV